MALGESQLAVDSLSDRRTDRAVDTLGHQIAGHHKMGFHLYYREMFGFYSFDCQMEADSLFAEMAFFRLLKGLLTSGLDS
jgi:hypothetical protein